MKRIKTKRGLTLPIHGAPALTIEDGAPVRSVALIGGDYVALKPSMLVSEGDRVKLGQPLFHDKALPAVQYTAPGAGVVTAINRGAKRVLQSVVIRLEGDEAETFAPQPADALATLDPETIKATLLQSGQWPALRTRPYNKIANPERPPDALFVNAMDSNPLAAPPELIIAEQHEAFLHGLQVLARLVEGPKYVCQAPEAAIVLLEHAGYEHVAFAGPHPAGLVGTHIHFLHPIGAQHTVWHIGYQDVIAIGKLFTTGRLWTERIIALGGPPVQRPRLLRTRLGANTEDLLQGELEDIECRAISGSVFAGRRAAGWASYLDRYAQQLSVLPEGRAREFMGWIVPSKNKFSKLNVFVSALDRQRQRFRLTTSQQGSPRAMVPVNYEAVMPLRILATQLLRALLVRDTDSAQALGCLELAEEDLALCSYVCVGKYDYGPVLRDNLTQIEKEG